SRWRRRSDPPVARRWSTGVVPKYGPRPRYPTGSHRWTSPWTPTWTLFARFSWSGSHCADRTTRCEEPFVRTNAGCPHAPWPFSAYPVPMRAVGGPRIRKLLLAVLSAAVAVSVFVVALRLTPQSAESTAASPPSSDPSPSSVPSTPPSAEPPTSSVPPTSRLRFEEWVDDVADWLDIPHRAMHAYATATVLLTEEQPDCHLSWVTLAGVGRTATDHGRVNGGTITEDGTMSEPIDTVEVRDFAGDLVSVPGAAGPLQLSPDVWERFKASPTEGTPDIQNIDDAALTAGRAMCAGGRDLSDGDGWLDGVSVLQDEPLFLHRVLATANVYGTVGENRSEPNTAALQAVMFAVDKIGLPYVWGGNGEEAGHDGFD